MVINIFCPPPPSLEQSIQKEIDRVKEITKDKNLKKSKEKLDNIAQKVYKEYKSWDKLTKANRNNLVEMNEMLEGVVEVTNFPFEGASNITISYASGMAKTFKATFNKTAYQDPDIFTAVSKKDEIKEQLPVVEEAVNYSFHSESNGLDILKQGTIPCLRDGTLIVSGFWNRRIEKCSDSKSYKTFMEFQNDYPTSMSADMSDEEYGEIADMFIQYGEDAEVVVNYQFDNILEDGPEYEIVPLARFVYFPIYAPSIKRMKMYGKEYFLSKSEIKEKSKRNEFYKDKVEELLKHKPSGEKDRWSASKNFIDKLSNSPTEEEKPMKLVDAVWKEDLDNDGIPEKYLVTFAPDFDGMVIGFKNYHIRNNIDFCVDFRLASREDRFLGISLLNEGQDKFKLLDAIHRNRNNVRMLTTSPIFLIDRRYKEELDLFRSENIIKPGTTFWVEDPDKAIKQLQLHDLSRNNDSLDEENQIVRYLEFCLGPTQAMSGKETQTDPRAPMGKTIALLQQANGRIDDYLDEFRRSIPELAKLHCALLAQFGPEQIKYTVDQDGKLSVKSADKKIFFDNSLVWRSKRRSVTLSPEFAMQRLGGLLQTYAQLLPLIQAQDTRAIEMWNRMVVASGEPQKEKLMIQAGSPEFNPIQQMLNRAGAGGAGSAGGEGGAPPIPQQTMSPSEKSPLNNV